MRYSVSQSVRTQQLDDELILLDLRGGEYFSLNASGAQVWRALEAGTPLEMMAQELGGDWPVDVGQRRQLIQALVDDLCARGLLRTVD
ncbi:MAG: PqqD family protein [Gemmatimonadales bacterium]